MNRIPVRRSLAALVVVGSSALADPVPLAAVRPVRPPVQLVAVRAVAAPAETARGTSPTPFDPFFDSARPGPAPAEVPAGYPVAAAHPQAQPGQPRGVWTMLTTWTQDRSKAIKSTLGVPPQQPQPDPRVGQPLPMGQPFPTQPFPTQPAPGQPFQGATAAGRAAYAGNPAYRWYGWGTTTPGANPYAPTGETPSASAQWYAMSRATPGAFPVPVTNPFREPPGATAPTYATRSASPKPAAVPPPAVAFEPPGPAPIAESAPFRYVPPDGQPVGATVVPTVPPAGTEWRGPTMPITSTGKPAVKEETTWQPVAYSPPPAPSVASSLVGQVVPAAATIDWQPPTLLDKVRAACGSGVTAVEVKKLGQQDVIVRFDAPSDAAAERAAKAVSELAELKPYTVTFDVAVTGK